MDAAARNQSRREGEDLWIPPSFRTGAVRRKTARPVRRTCRGASDLADSDSARANRLHAPTARQPRPPRPTTVMPGAPRARPERADALLGHGGAAGRRHVLVRHGAACACAVRVRVRLRLCVCVCVRVHVCVCVCVRDTVTVCMLLLDVAS
jgi:hypothetical protein